MSRPLEDKVEMICLLGAANHNFHEAERQFNMRHPERPTCRKYLRELVKKFRRTGSVNNGNSDKTERPLCWSLSPAIEMEILWEMVENPQLSSRAISKKYDIARATVMKYLKKNEFHANMIRKKLKLDETESSEHNVANDSTPDEPTVLTSL